MTSPLRFAEPVRFFHKGREYRMENGYLVYLIGKTRVSCQPDPNDPVFIRKARSIGWKPTSLVDDGFHGYSRKNFQA